MIDDYPWEGGVYCLGYTSVSVTAGYTSVGVTAGCTSVGVTAGCTSVGVTADLLCIQVTTAREGKAERSGIEGYKNELCNHGAAN